MNVVVLSFKGGAGPSHSSAEASKTTSGGSSTHQPMDLGPEKDAESALRGSSEASASGEGPKASGGGFVKKLTSASGRLVDLFHLKANFVHAARPTVEVLL